MLVCPGQNSPLNNTHNKITTIIPLRSFAVSSSPVLPLSLPPSPIHLPLHHQHHHLKTRTPTHPITTHAELHIIQLLNNSFHCYFILYTSHFILHTPSIPHCKYQHPASHLPFLPSQLLDLEFSFCHLSHNRPCHTTASPNPPKRSLLPLSSIRSSRPTKTRLLASILSS